MILNYMKEWEQGERVERREQTKLGGRKSGDNFEGKGQEACS